MNVEMAEMQSTNQGMKKLAETASIVISWGIAVVVAVVLGSIVQTGFNLAALAELGVPVGWDECLAAIGHDLVHFAPTYAVLSAIAFALAWPVAGLLSRRLHANRTLLFMLAGFSAVAVMILAMNQLLPVTAIAATRNASGLLAMSLAGASAGAIYVRLPVGGTT
ncbi:MAG: hypothetical protein RQ847_08720 [Wenzhouxiangellaceae bacterium]|nr:hypothetical protein [Wenzhouxiangellaceae bacterium]